MYYGAEHTYGARASDAWTYRGLRTVIIENELLRAVVLADKGADIMSLVHKPTDTELLWRSPWGVRNPATYVPTTGDPTALWLDFYEGGWQSVFPGGGFPSRHANADLGLHAESSLLPWDVHVAEEGPERACAEFKVRLARTPFISSRSVSIEVASPTLVVRETLTNCSEVEFPVSYGQHIAIGPPFLSEACVIDLPGGTVHNHPVDWSPSGRLKAAAVSRWPQAVLKDGSTVDLRRVPPRGADIEDQLYVADLADGWYAVTNIDLRVGLAVHFPKELYRFLWYWQVFSGGPGYPWWGRNYNIGLEPFTAATNRGLEAAVEDASALTLAPRESLQSEVLVTIYSSQTGVQSVGSDGTVHTKEDA
jgi:hypothetical protein